MDDASVVRFGQRLGDLVQDAKRTGWFDDAVAVLDLLQAFPPYQLHGQVEGSVLGLVEIVDGNGVRIAEFASRPRPRA